MFGEMAAYHPREPHWYLATIGMEPQLHRKGVGSALLVEALSRCDQDTWLPTWNPGIAAKGQNKRGPLEAVITESIAGEKQADVGAAFERTEYYRPTEPHWYLSLIGVE